MKGLCGFVVFGWYNYSTKMKWTKCLHICLTMIGWAIKSTMNVLDNKTHDTKCKWENKRRDKQSILTSMNITEYAHHPSINHTIKWCGAMCVCERVCVSIEDMFCAHANQNEMKRSKMKWRKLTKELSKQ